MTRRSGTYQTLDRKRRAAHNGPVAIQVDVNFSESAGRVQDIPLDGVLWTMQFSWSTLREAWSFSLIDQASGDPLFLGRKMSIGVDHLRQVSADNRPRGKLVVVDTSGAATPPERGDLANGRVKVVYLTEAEVNAG